MTTAQAAAILASLLSIAACSDGNSSSFAGNNAALGGSGPTTTGTSTTAGVGATGGAAPSEGTGGGTATGGSAGTSSSLPAELTTRCSDSTTGEVTLTHTPSPGQTNTLAGTTTITTGSLASFNASDLDLRFCFSVVGSVALTLTSGIIVDSASISGSGNYVNLAGTALSIESTSENNRYCIVFDIGAVAAAVGVTVSGATAVTYNWRFTKNSVDVGLMFDPRVQKVPELKATLNGNVGACHVVSS